jgi:hypothetical protein
MPCCEKVKNMKKWIFVLLCFFADLFAFDAKIESAPVDVDSAFIRLQALSFLKVFPSFEIKNGSYIFYEKNGIRRLFFYGENKDVLVMYQYPMQKESKWLNPEKYLEERKRKEQNKINESACRYKFENSEELIKILDSFQLEKNPYIWVRSNKKHDDSLYISKASIGGFVKGEITEYFYFRDVRNLLNVVPTSFNVYVDMFNFFENKFFKDLLKDCK